MGLRDRDLRSLLGLIETVNAARDPQAFRVAVLPALRKLVPSAYAAYNEIDHRGGGAYAIVDPAAAQFPDPGATLATVAHQNPLITHYARTRDGRALQIADFMSEDEWRATDFYRIVFEPLGVLHQIAIALPSQPTLTIGIALSDERRFDDRDRQLLDFARPHLVGAYRNAQLHAIAAAQLRALERGLESAGAGVIVLGRDGAVHAAGALANELLNLGPRLGEPLASWVASRRIAGPDGAAAPLILPDGDGSVLVRFLGGGGPPREPDLLLVERRADPLETAALRALGLTERQAQVLRLIAIGRPSSAIAGELGISHGTVRKHLEHLYRRLGVTTRGAAAAAAWAGAEAQGAVVEN
jgi:DNA-binding CsgD family transcriptional regulator